MCIEGGMPRRAPCVSIPRPQTRKKHTTLEPTHLQQSCQQLFLQPLRLQQLPWPPLQQLVLSQQVQTDCQELQSLWGGGMLMRSHFKVAHVPDCGASVLTLHLGCYTVHNKESYGRVKTAHMYKCNNLISLRAKNTAVTRVNETTLSKHALIGMIRTSVLL